MEISNEGIVLGFLFLIIIGLLVVPLIQNFLPRRKENMIDISRYSRNKRALTRTIRSNEIIGISDRNEEVTVIIGQDVLAITPRFFEDLFKEVVLKIGKEEFKKKFTFVTMGYPFERNLNEALYRIERKRKYEFVLD